jgi:hypothetical protein
MSLSLIRFLVRQGTEGCHPRQEEAGAARAQEPPKRYSVDFLFVFLCGLSHFSLGAAALVSCSWHVSLLCSLS